MRTSSYIMLFLTSMLSACGGVWVGSEFHFWALSFGIDMGAPHPVLALLEIGFIGVVMNEVRLTYFELSPYDYLIRARRTVVLLFDVFFLACIFGCVFAPIGNPVHRDAWVNPLSILLVAVFIPLLLFGKDLGVDIGHHLKNRGRE